MKRGDAGKAGAQRRPQLTRQQVVTAAVELADSGGIESISMRRLAQELGVEAMSLYTHVRSKEDLLDGIADAVIGMIPVDAVAADWRNLAPADGTRRARRDAPPPVGAARDRDTGRTRAGRPGVHQRGTRHPSRRRLLDRRRHTRPCTSSAAGCSGSPGICSKIRPPIRRPRPALPAEFAAAFPYAAEMAVAVAHGGALGPCDDDSEFEFALDFILDGLGRPSRQPLARRPARLVSGR